MGVNLQPDELTAGLAGHCQPNKKQNIHSLRNRNKLFVRLLQENKPTEKDWQKGRKRIKYFSLRNSLGVQKQVLTVKRTCTSFCTALLCWQHKSTCHSVHFHSARWRIPLQEYMHTNTPAHIPQAYDHPKA